MIKKIRNWRWWKLFLVPKYLLLNLLDWVGTQQKNRKMLKKSTKKKCQKRVVR